MRDAASIIRLAQNREKCHIRIASSIEKGATTEDEDKFTHLLRLLPFFLSRKLRFVHYPVLSFTSFYNCEEFHSCMWLSFRLVSAHDAFWKPISTLQSFVELHCFTFHILCLKYKSITVHTWLNLLTLCIQNLHHKHTTRRGIWNAKSEETSPYCCVQHEDVNYILFSREFITMNRYAYILAAMAIIDLYICKW